MSLELELVQAWRRYLEHLSGKHNQKSHGNKYGSVDAVKGNVKRLGGDKAALKSMAKRARGDSNFQDEVSKNSSFSPPKTDYKGGGKRLKNFTKLDGSKVDGVATEYGSLVLVTRKVGGNQYAKLFTKNGAFVPILPQSPINGEVKNIKKSVEELAKMADWEKMTKIPRAKGGSSDFVSNARSVVQKNVKTRDRVQ